MFELVKVSNLRFRAQENGTTVLYALDSLRNAGATAQSIAHRVGCKIKTKKVIVIEPVTLEATPAVAVTKLTDCRTPKKPGRKPKPK